MEASLNTAPETVLSRNDFLKKIWHQAAAPLIESVEEKVQNIHKPLEGKRRFLRPPGAVENDNLFMALCTRCDACTAACPHEAISVHYGASYPYDKTPVLANLSQSPCLMCEDLPCIASCPTTALQPLASIQDIKIGEAKIDNTTCLAYRGESCTVCVDVCPLKGQAIALVENLPQVYEACTGCGICQQQCPTQPKSIVVFPA